MTQGGQSREAFVPVQVGRVAPRLYNTDPIVKRGEEEEEEEWVFDQVQNKHDETLCHTYQRVPESDQCLVHLAWY